MTVVKSFAPMPALTRPSAKASQYDFAQLRPGTEDCFLEFDFVDAQKGKNRLSSATVAWRKRTGSDQRFVVREIAATNPATGQTEQALGVWAVVAKVAAAAAAEATEAGDTAPATV